ncbi:polysaccharide lyase family 7 protein [Vibrio sp. FNV 38]|nr:polysaccharide lyase family 7 protein [Vibrio sp. FNV 38]
MLPVKRTLIAIAIASLVGCGGSSGSNTDSSVDPVEPTDPSEPLEPTIPEDVIVPFSITKFQEILASSDLQLSDPDGSEGNKESVVKDGEFEDYISDYFYADSDDNLVFSMSNYKMRSEIRELDNFSIKEDGIKRTWYAEVLLPNIDIAMASSPADHDEVTFLQIHNKGTSEDGTGYIPHPLLRIVWEQERDGLTGHYWAVVKNNVTDCTQVTDSSSCYATSYDRYDLGYADLENFTRFSLSVFDSTLQISVDDTEKETIDISYWEHLLSYFKAGVYNQFENGEAQVHFRQLSLDKTLLSPIDTWDLDEWKLTIPASKDSWYGEGGDSAAELEPERCYSSKDVLNDESNVYDESIGLSYFNIVDDNLHFRADMGFGTSTTNSSYIRSELRELYVSDDDPDCSTSDEDTSWYLDDTRTEKTIHTLSAALTINDYPDISFDEQRPKVVLGQIHGWKINQALVKLLWEGGDKPVRVILNDSFERNNNDCDECDPFSVTLGTYQADEEWQYTIRADEDGVFLATYDSDGSNMYSHQIDWGSEYADMNGDTVSLSNEWTDSDIAFYFKAGIYPQFKPSDEYQGQVFDVSFSTLNIEHK